MTPAQIPPILYTKRCRLDRIMLHDIDVLRNIVEDVQFRLFLPELYELIHNADGMNQFLSSFDAYAQNGDGFLWGIWKQSFLIGFVAIMDISYEPTIFYAMHSEFRNKGFAKEAVVEVVAYYKSISNTPLHTEVFQTNLPSLSILASCGFRVTGSKDNKFLLTLQETMPSAQSFH